MEPATHTMNDPSNALFIESVLESFNSQPAMRLIRATMPLIEEGYTEIHVPHWDGVEQQHGFVHGGVIGMIADAAAGYAALTLVKGDDSVLTVEYKINFVAPARGEKMIAQGKVIKPGRTLIVTMAEVFSVRGDDLSLCAVMQQTMMVVSGMARR